ncbi:MAG: hypothetical protein R3F24_03485 [Gammaproteobacteria bacterium]
MIPRLSLPDAGRFKKPCHQLIMNAWTSAGSESGKAAGVGSNVVAVTEVSATIDAAARSGQLRTGSSSDKFPVKFEWTSEYRNPPFTIDGAQR